MPRRSLFRPGSLHVVVVTSIAIVISIASCLFARGYADDRFLLTGNHPSAADVLAPQGNAELSTDLEMQVRFKPHNRKALVRLLADQQDPSSPEYHRWLKTTDFAQRFEPSETEIESLTEWLKAEGFSITSTSLNAVEFSGTVAQAQRTFAVTIARFGSGNVYANTTDPLVPRRFAHIIGAILGMDNMVHAVPSVSVPDTTYEVTPLGSGRSPFGPIDFYDFYDEKVAAGKDGSGACIAIVGTSDFLDQSMTALSDQFELPRVNYTRKVHGTNPGINQNEAEAELDIQWTHVAAPGAEVVFHLGANVVDDIADAINDNTCGAISINYGFCGYSPAFMSEAMDPLFQQAAAQGQSVFVSAGNQGTAALRYEPTNNSCAAEGDQSVNELSADPNVTSIGGTQFVDRLPGGGGHGYAVERAWSDASGATGGGTSRIFAKPDYQAGPGVPDDGARDVPDVSMMASPNLPGVLFEHDIGGEAQVVCCGGGTSLATSIWAGFSIVLAQIVGQPRLGNINPLVYQLANQRYEAAGFRDVANGSNRYNGATGYSAEPGYDLSTGWGTVDFDVFANAVKEALSGGLARPSTPSKHDTFETANRATTGKQADTSYETPTPAGAPTGTFTTKKRAYQNLVEDYGASGSIASLSGCTTTVGSNQITCPRGIGDFKVGEGVDIPLAGPASPLPNSPSFGALTVNGTPGSTTITYALCAADPWKGIAGACATASVSTGPAIVTLASSISVPWNLPSVNSAIGLIYRKIGSGAWRFVTVADSPGTTFYDIGWTPPCSATGCGWPTSPPGAAQNQDLFSYVTSINGNTLILHDNASAALSGAATVEHDDTLAAEAALANCGGGIVQFGPSTYRIVRPAVFDFGASQPYPQYRTFTSNTGGHGIGSLYGFGLLDVPSSCTVQGAGKGVTTILTDYMANSNMSNTTFDIDDLTSDHHAPFYWPVTPTNCAINNASIGAASVTTTTASCAGNFVSGDYVIMGGGSDVAGSSGLYFNEMTTVISANAATGLIKVADPLQHPLPMGSPGLSPTIYKMTGSMTHDVTISDMTIENYSGIFMNPNGLYRITVTNVNAPFYGNNNSYFGNNFRHGTFDNDSFVTDSNEWSLDEDILYRNTTWTVFGAGFYISEGTSSITFDTNQITLNEWSCLPAGQICTPTNGVNGLTAHGNINNFQVLNSEITCNAALSNATEGGLCLGVQGGLISGYTAYGLNISGNTIVTTSRYGISQAYSNTGSHIDNNKLTLAAAAENPIVGVLARSGTISNNTIQVTGPTHTTDGYAILDVTPEAPFLPITAEGNKITGVGKKTHTAFYVGDPGSLDPQPIVFTKNTAQQVNTGFQVMSPARTPKVKMSSTNKCRNVTSCH